MDKEMDKHQALTTLKVGLANRCADDLTEVLINLEDNTCNYVELIPVLEEIARVDWFYYFDDNGAGGQPHADSRRKTSFKSWAQKAIANINENQKFESSSMVHAALKSNNTLLVKSTLELLCSEGRIADKSLIPILEKIARKDVYGKYAYIGGFGTDCKLGELAHAVLKIIQHPMAVYGLAKSTSVSDSIVRICSVCSPLPDDLTVNTGREEYFPDAFSQLLGMDDDYRSVFRRCPECRTYFNWIDMPQMYGSGNNDEERLVRLSRDKSQLLDKLFSADITYRPSSGEIEEYMGTLPLDLLVPALVFHLHRTPKLVSQFIPSLLILLQQNDDTSLWSLLTGYVSDSPGRAEEVLASVGSGGGDEPNRINQIREHCLSVVKR